MTDLESYNLVKEDLIAAERKRRNSLLLCAVFLALFVASVFVGRELIIEEQVVWGAVMIIFFFLIFFGGSIFLYYSLKRFFQKSIAKKIVEGLGAGFSYDADGKIPEYLLSQSMLFEKHTEYYCEDYIKGENEGKKFSYAEIRLEKKEANPTNRRHDTLSVVFKGVFYVQGLRVKLPETFMIVPKKSRRWRTKGWFGGESSIVLDPFDHEKFDQVFKVLAGANSQLVRKLLAPHLLDQIIEVNTTLRAKKLLSSDLAFSFRDDHIFIAIPLRTGKGLLDPTFFRSMDSLEFLAGQLVVLQNVMKVGQIF
jgi:hypothetical protein